MVTRYDIVSDSLVEVTQEDWNLLEKQLQKLAHFAFLRPDERELGTGPQTHCPLPSLLSARLKVYPNPMRDDGVFIAEDKEIFPYPDLIDIHGKMLYPAIPQTGLKLGTQVPYAFAAEIVKRWNAWLDNQEGKVDSNAQL